MRDAYFITAFRVTLGCGPRTRSWSVGRIKSTAPFIRTRSAVRGWLGVAPGPSFCRLAGAVLPWAPRAAGKAIHEQKLLSRRDSVVDFISEFENRKTSLII